MRTDDAEAHDPQASDEAGRRAFDWRPRTVWTLVKNTLVALGRDKAPKQAAALAYYSLFAIGPLLAICVFVAGLLFGATAARGAIMGQLGLVLGPQGAQALADIMAGSSRPRVGVAGTVVGAIALLAGAVGVFAQLKETMNAIWEVDAKPRKGFRNKVWGAIRDNLLSFGALLGGVFLLLLSLALSALLAAVSSRVGGALGLGAALGAALDLVLTLAVVTLLFTLMFKFIPDAKVSAKDTFKGALVTAVLFVAGEYAISLYIGRGPIATQYGAAGAVLAILVWLYYTSLIVFVGAELTQVYANSFGAHVRPSRNARSLQEAVMEDHRAPGAEGAEQTPRDPGRERQRGRRPT